MASKIIHWLMHPWALPLSIVIAVMGIIAKHSAVNHVQNHKKKYIAKTRIHNAMLFTPIHCALLQLENTDKLYSHRSVITYSIYWSLHLHMYIWKNCVTTKLLYFCKHSPLKSTSSIWNIILWTFCLGHCLYGLFSGGCVTKQQKHNNARKSHLSNPIKPMAFICPTYKQSRGQRLWVVKKTMFWICSISITDFSFD